MHHNDGMHHTLLWIHFCKYMMYEYMHHTAICSSTGQICLFHRSLDYSQQAILSCLCATKGVRCRKFRPLQTGIESALSLILSATGLGSGSTQSPPFTPETTMSGAQWFPTKHSQLSQSSQPATALGGCGKTAGRWSQKTAAGVPNMSTRYSLQTMAMRFSRSFDSLAHCALQQPV